MSSSTEYPTLKDIDMAREAAYAEQPHRDAQIAQHNIAGVALNELLKYNPDRTERTSKALAEQIVATQKSAEASGRSADTAGEDAVIAFVADKASKSFNATRDNPKQRSVEESRSVLEGLTRRN